MVLAAMSLTACGGAATSTNSPDTSVPSFKSDEFPDLTMPGWNSEFDSFWQNNASGGASGTGSGTGTQATATATATP
jgi:hypothetical protein